MQLIVHKIRLLAQSYAERFENWVQTSDYAACPQLPSVISFSVQRADPGADFDYFEVITVTSLEAFEKDMRTDVFGSLVAAFSNMAEVQEEIIGTRLGEGYVRSS